MIQLWKPVAVLAAASIVWAQTAEAQTADVQLSPRTTTLLLNNPDQFIEHTIQQLFSLSPNGKLTREALAIRDQMTTARQRANRLGIALEFDLQQGEESM